MAKGKVGDKGKGAFWRQTVREQRQTGPSIWAFCPKCVLHESAFCSWCRELTERETAQPAPAASCWRG
jgi:hypothetical protein